MWIGAVAAGDQLNPLSSVHLVGPEMLVFQRGSKNGQAIARKPVARRWSRLSGAMGSKVFRTFRNRSVLLIGGGRLGSLIATSLIRMGLLRLTNMDPDRLESHNRDATFGNVPADVGKFKSEILIQDLHKINPRSTLKAIPESVLGDRAIDEFRKHSLIISCVDDDSVRMEISRMAARLLRVHLDLGTLVHNPSNDTESTDREIGADVRLTLPGACLNCVGGLERVSEDAGLDTTNASVEEDWQSGGRAGSLLSINHMAVGTAIQMWIDLLAGKINSSFWQRIRWVQGQGLQTAAGAVTGSPTCPVCHFRQHV